MNSEVKKKAEEVVSLKEILNDKDKEIERVKEQRNKLANGELDHDIIYNEAVQERQSAIER